MKKSLLFISFISLGISLFGQKYSYYSPQLSDCQKEFRNYALGIVVYQGDSTLIKTEPIFNRIYLKGEYVIAQLIIGGNNYSDKVTFFTNEVWLCLDKNLKLKFFFPVGTQDVTYSEKENVFLYTTYSSSSFDFWHNTGVINSDGHIICNAIGNLGESIHRNILVYSYDTNMIGENDVRTVLFRIDSISEKKSIADFSIKIPSFVWKEIDTSLHCWNYDSDNQFYNAYKSIFNITENSEAESAFKTLIKSKDSVISLCARYNYKELKKVKRKLRETTQAPQS